MIYLIEILLEKYLTDCDRIIDLLDLESIKKKKYDTRFLILIIK